MTKHKGFTAMELLLVIVMLASIIGSGLILYAIFHFVAKFW